MQREIRVGGERPNGKGRRYNVIVVFDPNYEAVLLELKHKGPYPGQYNFPGGKLEEGEEPEAGAARELLEETRLGPDNVWPLQWLTTCTFPEDHNDFIILDVFYTRVKTYPDMDLVPTNSDVGDPICWRSIDTINSANDATLAGQGNLPYLTRLAREKLLGAYFVKL